MKILVLGAGSFGTAIAQQLAVNPENEIEIFFREAAAANIFNTHKINEKYFPNYRINQAVSAVYNPEEIQKARVVLLAVPAKNMKRVCVTLKPFLSKDTLLVNLSKGIYKGGLTLVEFLKRELDHKNTVSLKGPSFSAEMIHNQATLMTLGFENRKQLKCIKRITTETNIFLDYTSDIRGVELLSALKNIYAILLGNTDARYNSANTRFLVLTKAVSEIKLILKNLGGREETIFLGCGLGDINLTALNDLSRNRTLGLLIGKGFYSPDYRDNSVVLEGIKTLELIQTIIPDRLNDRLPLLQQALSFFLSKEGTALQFDFDDLFKKRYTTVLTYGTFDLLHYGHLEILRRAKELGDYLIVGLSTDQFNREKGKNCKFSFEKRKEFLESLVYVDQVISEEKWEQKVSDVKEYEVDVFVMGNDWSGKFDFLKEFCQVYYFQRTKGISTTKLKEFFIE